MVRNNNIYINRGETGSIDLEVWYTDGTPYVLPVVKDKGLLSIAAHSKNARHADVIFDDYYTFFTPVYPHTIDSYGSVVSEGELVINATDGAQCIAFGEDMYGAPITSAQAALNGTAVIESNDITWYAIGIYGGKIKSVSFVFGGRTEVYTNDYDKAVISILALTVRSAETDAIVLTKYLNLSSSVIYDGEFDNSQSGWNKFTNQKPVHIDALTPEAMAARLLDEKIEVFEFRGGYIHSILKEFYGDDGNKFYAYAHGVPYKFTLSIPIEHEDTAHLHGSEYTYDIICYQGLITDESAFDNMEYPFKRVLYKKELIPPHRFIIGGSNNV